MVPIYSTVAWLSFYYYRHAVYFDVMGNCYEAFTISAFFALLCHYIAPDLHSQKEYFRGIKPKKWLWPVNWLEKIWGGETGPWRTPRSGLTWFNVRAIYSGISLLGQVIMLIFGPDHMDRSLPVLSGQSHLDYRCGHHAETRPILRGVSESGVCTRLGALILFRLMASLRC